MPASKAECPAFFLHGSIMKRISYLLICCLSLQAGCRTADSLAWIPNPSKVFKQSSGSDIAEADVEANSKKFLEDVRKQAATQTEQVNQHVQRGQQEIVSWYQDQDDRHISAAKENFRAAMKLQPKQNVDALHGLAVVADLEQKFEVAEQHYQLALAQTPGDPNLLGNLGYSYLLQNRLDESERYLTRATEIDPNHLDAVKHLGDVYLKQGQFGKAEATYRRVMSAEESRLLVAKAAEVPPEETKNSLMGRFLPQHREKVNIASDPHLNELRRLQAEQARADSSRDQSQGRESLPPANSQLGYTYPPNSQYPPPEIELKSRLASIERERHAHLDGRAVVINSETGRTQRGPESQQWSNTAPSGGDFSGKPQQPADVADSPQRATRPAPTVADGASAPGSQLMREMRPQLPEQNIYAEMSPYQQQQFERTQQMRLTGSPGINPQLPVYVEQMVARPGQLPAHMAPAVTASQVLAPRTGDPLQTPWGGSPANSVPVNDEYDSQQNRGSRNVSSNFEYGSSREPQFSQSEVYGDAASGGTPARALSQSRQAQNLRPGFNDFPGRSSQQELQVFEAATLEAAKLGMGMQVSNGEVVHNQTTPQQQPGTQSHWNGNSFDQVRRVLPSDLAPLDIGQGARSPVVNSLGQQLPGSGMTNEYDQFGTASRYDLQLQQASGQVTSSSQQALNQLQAQQLQMEQQLREQRAPAQAQFSQQTQDVWNHRPMTLHAPALGSPALLSPAEYGGMVPSQQTAALVAPPAYSRGQQGEQVDSNYGRHREVIYDNYGRPIEQQSQSERGTYYDAQPGMNIVEPPPYRPAAFNDSAEIHDGRAVQQAGYSQVSGGSYGGHAGFQMRANSNLPMIVPGNP